jgi:ABC-type cobalamin/Fe3+-siderophores transport system ATPase subunit
MALRLRLYYGFLVLIYALEAAVVLFVLATLSQGVMTFMLSSTQELKTNLSGIWLFLNILASIAIPCGIVLQRFLHRHERYLYLNHGLNAAGLYTFATLMIWFISALSAVALHLWQNNQWLNQQLKVGFQFVEIQFFEGLNGLLKYPLVITILASLLLICLVCFVIYWLSAPNESAETKDSIFWELSIDSVTHSFGKRHVLKGAWLKCCRGQIVGLLGRNGCGKSTLLQIIFGTLKADYRALFVNGHSIRHLFKLNLSAYLPQDSFLPQRMKVKRVIRLFVGQPLEGLLAEEPRIKELYTKRVNELSGGEKRFLELGLVLALKRPFVFLDEPFSELEPLYKKRVRSWLIKTAEQGSAIIITDHDYTQILKLSNPLILMHHGQTEVIEDLRALDKIYLPV